MAAQALERLERAPLTAPGGIVIVQIHPRERPDIDAVTLSRLRLYDERTYGSTLLMFFEHPADETSDAPQNPAQETTP